jgi:hypothetical protein
LAMIMRMIIKKQIFVTILLVFVVCSVASCASLSEEQKKEYSNLESAVTFSAEKVIGEFGDKIPGDLSAEKFMKIVEGKIPRDYYQELKKYNLEVRSKRMYYLLLVFDPATKALILFDYSCTSTVDGPVLLEPGKYDINRLELYDKCK